MLCCCNVACLRSIVATQKFVACPALENAHCGKNSVLFRSIFWRRLRSVRTSMLHRTENFKIHIPRYNFLLLYSQTKGVKQKYIRYISGSVAYRQYIHKCNSLLSPNWLPAVSHSPPPLLLWILSPQRLSAAESSLPHNDSQTPGPISSLRLLVGDSSFSLSSLDSRSSRSFGSLG